MLSLQRDRCFVLSIPHEIAEDIVQVVVLERCCLGVWEKSIRRFCLSGWDLGRRQQPSRPGRNGYGPFFAR